MKVMNMNFQTFYTNKIEISLYEDKHGPTVINAKTHLKKILHAENSLLDTPQSKCVCD